MRFSIVRAEIEVRYREMGTSSIVLVNEERETTINRPYLLDILQPTLQEKSGSSV